uniref:Uncharacterized protein n=1 Tax=Vespula pensylvanica TaxID=30213 RepID=A0A834N6U3_VESPE|nr:hypothetical protein H0235_016651 [Vespula pensylvanica]
MKVSINCSSNETQFQQSSIRPGLSPENRRKQIDAPWASRGKRISDGSSSDGDAVAGGGEMLEEVLASGWIGKQGTRSARGTQEEAKTGHSPTNARGGFPARGTSRPTPFLPGTGCSRRVVRRGAPEGGNGGGGGGGGGGGDGGGGGGGGEGGGGDGGGER